MPTKNPVNPEDEPLEIRDYNLWLGLAYAGIFAGVLLTLVSLPLDTEALWTAGNVLLMASAASLLVLLNVIRRQNARARRVLLRSVFIIGALSTERDGWKSLALIGTPAVDLQVKVLDKLNKVHESAVMSGSWNEHALGGISEVLSQLEEFIEEGLPKQALEAHPDCGISDHLAEILESRGSLAVPGGGA